MNALSITKSAVSIVVGCGASKIISGIVKNNTDPTKFIDKVTIATGSYVLGAIVAEATKEWTDAKIDEIVEKWHEGVAKFKSKVDEIQ